MTTAELKSFFKEGLKKAGIESADFEAEQLAQYTDPERREQTLRRRLSGEPLQYILGEWDFYGITLKVGEGVLIPRPDTETVAERAIKLLKGNEKPLVYDLCAGSGCIGIALAKFGGAKVKFFEKSEKALKYLKVNVESTNTNGEIIVCDVLEEPNEDLIEADLIISNPPYIKSGVMPSLQREVQFEPKMALDGGEDGLIFYRTIANKWKKKIKKGGYLVFEIGFDQMAEVTEILKMQGYSDVTAEKDLCGNYRVVYGKNI